MTDDLKELQTAHERRLVKIKLAQTAAASVSIFATSYGIMQKSVEFGISDTVTMGMALIASLAAGTVLTTATLQLFDIAVDAAKSQHGKVAVLLFLLLGPILGISTNFSYMATSGGISVAYDMEDKAEGWEGYMQQSLADAEKSHAAFPSILQIKNRVCDDAKGELERGALSGSAGPGELSSALGSACTSATTIVETLEETTTKSKQHRKEAMEIVNRLTAIPKDESISDVFTRQRAFRHEVGKLKEIIGHSVTEKVAERLSTELTILESSVSDMEGMQAPTGRFEQRQRRAITNLKQSLEGLTEAVSALLQDENSVSIEQPQKLRDMQESIFTYTSKTWPQALLALCLDLMPIFFCFLLTLSRDIPRARYQEIQEEEERDASETISASTEE